MLQMQMQLVGPSSASPAQKVTCCPAELIMPPTGTREGSLVWADGVVALFPTPSSRRMEDPEHKPT